MKLLLDTHIVLWWLADSSNLTVQTRELISNPENIIFVSTASIWEIRIKQALGKIDIDNDFADVLRKESFEIIPIVENHAHGICELPLHHRDPFDRILISQARIEKLTIVTHDKLFYNYDVKVILC